MRYRACLPANRLDAPTTVRRTGEFFLNLYRPENSNSGRGVFPVLIFALEEPIMSRMAIRLRTASFAMLLGLGASNAFAQSPAEFIEQASAKGMADIETSRMAHAKTSSQEIKDYTIEVINERTLANQHLASIAKKLDLPVAPR